MHFHLDRTSSGRGRCEVVAMQQAIARCRIGSRRDFDYINAHGTSTDLNDKFETMAIKNAFGEHAQRLQ